MTNPIYTLKTKEDEYNLSFIVEDTKRGLICSLTGGESPHVGCVCLSVPRKSLTGNGLSCDTYITPVCGHKDHIVAQKVAEKLCVSLNVPVSITCGIHVDNATSDQIKDIQRKLDLLIDKMLNLVLDKKD